MSRQVLRVAWYQFRATFRRGWGGYLALVLLVGLLGGLAMASAAGARRTQSSYTTFLASTNPSQLNVSIFTPGPVPPTVTETIAHITNVKRVESAVTLNIAPLGSEGTPTADAFNTFNGISTLGSVDGLFFDQDRVAVVTVAWPTRPELRNS